MEGLRAENLSRETKTERGTETERVAKSGGPRVYRGGLAGIERVEADAARVLVQVLEPGLDKGRRGTELCVVTLITLAPFLPPPLLILCRSRLRPSVRPTRCFVG